MATKCIYCNVPLRFLYNHQLSWRQRKNEQWHWHHNFYLSEVALSEVAPYSFLSREDKDVGPESFIESAPRLVLVESFSHAGLDACQSKLLGESARLRDKTSCCS